jgi:hypothetical protein
MNWLNGNMKPVPVAAYLGRLGAGPERVATLRQLVADQETAFRTRRSVALTIIATSKFCAEELTLGGASDDGTEGEPSGPVANAAADEETTINSEMFQARPNVIVPPGSIAMTSGTGSDGLATLSRIQDQA